MSQSVNELLHEIEALRSIIETQKKQLSEAEKQRQFFFKSLEYLIFLCSHKVRQPISQIQGLSNILVTSQSHQEARSLIQLVSRSANSLDAYTKEFSSLVYNLKMIYNPGTAGAESGNNETP